MLATTLFRAVRQASVQRHAVRATSALAHRPDQFLARHLGPREDELEHMLNFLGFDSLDALAASTVPAEIRLPGKLGLPEPATEQDALAELRSIADTNASVKSLIGAGYYGTHTPGVILRNVLENPAWYTSYTPYQAEIAQGRLQMLLNFQTMLNDLTGMQVANASLLDEGTAAAEAMQLCSGVARTRRAFFVAEDCHPQTIGVVRTRAAAVGIDIEVGPAEACDLESERFCGILLQYPTTEGRVVDYEGLAARAKETKTMVIAAADLLSLSLLRPPAEWGADVVVGSAQRFGVPMGFGGPHAGFLAAGEKMMRRMPGRIIGVSKDSAGDRALRMAMQTREQHIRRATATSNICTAQALLANMAASYAIYHGEEGIREIAERVRAQAMATATALAQAGLTVPGAGDGSLFDTVTVCIEPEAADLAIARALEAGYNLRRTAADKVSIAFDETTTVGDVEAVIGAFGFEVTDLAGFEPAPLPAPLARTTPSLPHGVFKTHRSETEMLRYLYTLQQRDLSLATSMISLGSCTMKLNATSEMVPITWDKFANVHPFAPRDQVVGYETMISQLADWLCKLTGFAAMSMQPNSGAQGEFAGLLCIRRYLEANGQGQRNICLVPESAHGTNPASAVLAGMKVVVVKNTAAGNIDHADLRAKIEKHGDSLAAMMITYPSTYGVFEEGVKDAIAAVHEAGGLVYMDGANMNAQIGLCSPGDIGADVCHLNLHKTFCIPHGGGGPGVGSIGVNARLAPHLPGHCVEETGGHGVGVEAKADGAVTSAQYGSALILPITWMYVRMLGESGLGTATKVAILNANYMAKRLSEAYDILYTGSNGQCAHEFIIDLRPIKKQTGVSEEDVAKRLVDYGFHAPTMSWPVPGTLMVEPTESEDLGEMDRFVDALLAIREEINDVAEGRIALADSPLVHAPHTAKSIAADDWDRAYSREKAVYPAPWSRVSKFWPFVGRVDNVHGDRNLVCTCPPVSSYVDL